MKRLIRRWWVIVLVVLSQGCLGLGKSKPPAIEVAKPTPPPKQVKTGGACIELGQGRQPAFSVEEFVDKAAELLAAKQVDTAREFIGLYPDLCQESLRRASTAEGKADALQLIAVVHDEQAGLEGTLLS